MAQRRCTPTDIIKVTSGSPLQLECGSHCPGDNIETSSSFSWRKQLDISDSSSNNMVQLPNTMDPVLSIESVTHEDGGHYVCKCLPNGPECMYNVSGKSFIPGLRHFLHAAMFHILFRYQMFKILILHCPYSSSRNDI